MQTFFTVDRHGTLTEGLELTLKRYRDINPPELQAHADLLFPDGVTSHGDRYLLNGESTVNIVSPFVELVCEYVRRAHFPDRPSRFQSVFASGSPKEAAEFARQFGQGLIWEVTAQNYFRADMNLLRTNNSLLVTSWFAHTYWTGQASTAPFFEFLLIPPVYILCQVTVSEHVLEDQDPNNLMET